LYQHGKPPTPQAIPIRPGGTLLRILCIPFLGVFAILILILALISVPLTHVDPKALPPFFALTLRLLYTGFHYLGSGLRLALPGPALLIAEEYLEDRSGLLKTGRVPWNEIVSAERAEVFVESGVAVHLSDPDAWIRQAPVWQRAFLHLNGWLFHTPVFIPVSCMAITTDELIDAIYTRMKEVQPHADPVASGDAASRTVEPTA